jgi:hypothetical protein
MTRVSVTGRERSPHSDCRWGTIRYALDSNARTLRLCIIVVVCSIPPGLLALLIRR